MSKEKKYTPMMMQYIEMKKKHPDEIVFYRLGDFYEMFFDDAKIASQELDLVLTGKNAGVEEKVPMCGIPYHAASGYIQRLIQKGYKVAIVEQMENPAEAKGIVKRDLLKIVTPGTIMDEAVDDKSNAYIAGIHDFQYGLALVLCEMTTGEMIAQTIDKQLINIQKVLLGNHVVEVVIDKAFDKKIVKMLKEISNIVISYQENHHLNINYQFLMNGNSDSRIEFALGSLVNYLEETQRKNMAHLKPIQIIQESNYMQMDYNTRINLELVETSNHNQKSITLWKFLDHCRSAIGSRLLRKWIEFPLIDINEINKRLNAIEYLNNNIFTKDELKDHLSYVYDMDRLCARIAYGNANARDIQRLVKTLEHAPMIIDLFKDCKEYASFASVNLCDDLYQRIKNAIVDNPPLTLREGGIFVDGYNQELDEVRNIGKNGKKWILDLENKEKERTGIKSLKIGYNRVFGYYIEVTKANLNLVKEEFGYVRKQTLTNAERFITDELKQKEDAIIHASERSIALEQSLFMDLVKDVRKYLDKLYELSSVLSYIDALYSLAIVSCENGYCRPQFNLDHSIDIEEGRHPILDQMFKTNKYISNNLRMDNEEWVMMITGPNMGGKSTYMRQNALIVIMAQIGCFVPARKAKLPIFDAIYTRIGASDDILAGQSTFMVEMMEANYALKNATENSLVLFDEIGRGTSTYDGMALAQAMIEYILKVKHCKTLFSTHYHELTQLEAHYQELINVHVDVHEENEQITFLYRIVEGKADKSYGINVARLAHLPIEVLERARQILEHLECEKVTFSLPGEIKVVEKVDEEALAIKESIKAINLDKMTPMEALVLLNELKQQIKE